MLKPKRGEGWSDVQTRATACHRLVLVIHHEEEMVSPLKLLSMRSADYFKEQGLCGWTDRPQVFQMLLFGS